MVYIKNLNVNIKKLYEGAIIPTYGSDLAAGADLYAYISGSEPVMIPPHYTVMIGTGVAMAVPEGYWGGVFARSGIASKQGLRPANCVGVVDPDYRGEVIVALHNDSNDLRIVHHGDRIAQYVIMPRIQAEYNVVDELDDTARGDGGFGHTGV